MAKIITMEIPVWQAWIATRLGINPRELTDIASDAILDEAAAKHPKFPGVIKLTKEEFLICNSEGLNRHMITETTRVEGAGMDTAEFRQFERAYHSEGDYKGNMEDERQAYLEGYRARTLWDNKEEDVPLS